MGGFKWTENLNVSWTFSPLFHFYLTPIYSCSFSLQQCSVHIINCPISLHIFLKSDRKLYNLQNRIQCCFGLFCVHKEIIVLKLGNISLELFTVMQNCFWGFFCSYCLSIKVFTLIHLFFIHLT